MSEALVSVLIPAYRAAAYIGKALESVRAQTHANWEVLVLEDGILDDTAERVRAFAASVAQPVRLVQKPRNEGVSRARNALLDEARGEFIAFLDADDLWVPDHLSHSLTALSAEKADWIIGGLDRIDSSDAVIEREVLPPVMTAAEMPTRLLVYNFILPSGMVSRRVVFSGGLRFDTSLSVGEDLDLCIRIAAAGFVPAFSRRATLKYRKHPTSTTADPARFSEGMSQLLEKYLDSPLVDRRTCRRLLQASLLTTARLTWRSQPKRCRAAARRLLRLRFWDVRGLIYCGATLLNRRQMPA